MKLVELAQCIGNHRLDHRLILEEVAAQSGLVRSRLSQVENFRIAPSLLALGQITSALGVSVADLLEGLDQRPKRIKVKKAERQVVEQNQSSRNTIVDEPLADNRPSLMMDPFLLTVPTRLARDEAPSHDGEMFPVSQQGSINFDFNGEVHVTRNGDRLYFDSHVPH